MNEKFIKNNDNIKKLLLDVSKKNKCIGHFYRLKILMFISLEDKVCVRDIWECLEENQSVVSQHLSILKRCGVVESISEGNRRYYKIIDPLVSKYIESLKLYLKEKDDK